MIKAENVTKKYSRNGKVFNALDSVNLSFPDRGFYSIEGESGAGKSTLLSILALLDRPDTGNVYYDNVLITKKNAAAIRSLYVSSIPQEGGLIEDLTVEQNLLPLTRNDVLINETLRRVGIEEKTNSKVCDLSGGEKRRVGIARCLLKNSQCIFMDEPTADLDEENAEGIFQIANELSASQLVVFSTHDHELASRYCDGRLLISNGKIIESTLPDEKSSLNKEGPKPRKATLPFKMAFPFLLHTLKAKKARVLGSFAASALSLCIFVVLLSVFSFNSSRAFSSILQTSDISFVPLLESPTGKEGNTDNKYPIRHDGMLKMEADFDAACPYLIGAESEKNVPVFVFPYRERMKFDNITIQEPKAGECVCNSFLAKQELAIKLTNDFSAANISFSVAQCIENDKKPKEYSAHQNQQQNYEDLMQHFAYVIINDVDFDTIFSLTNTASLPASNFLADDVVSPDRYFKDKVKYAVYSDQNISVGSYPKSEKEVVVSKSFLNRISYRGNENELIGRTYPYRESSYEDTNSLYFRKCIDLKRLLGSVTIVGISDSEESDVFVNQNSAEVISQELLYYSGGVGVYTSNAKNLSKQLALFHYVSPLSLFAPAYQAHQFSSSPISKIMFIGSLIMLALSVLAISLCLISLFEYREKSLFNLQILGVNEKSLFLLFLVFIIGFSLAIELLGSLFGALVIRSIDFSLFGNLPIYSLISLIPVISFGFLLAISAITELISFRKLSSKKGRA